MNAPYPVQRAVCRLADMADPGELRRIEAFVASDPAATPFHRPAWLMAAARGTGNRAHILVTERADGISALLPLIEAHSPIFERVLSASGFGVGGGMLGRSGERLWAAAEELAERRSCSAIEIKGGVLPVGRAGWQIEDGAHCGFVRALAADDEAELLAIPRKQRAEVRKGLAEALTVDVGAGPAEREAHYAVYAQSVRNLGTPVFPKALFSAVLDAFGADADILTVRHEGVPVASVLSLYHRGAVMPFWGGGTASARKLRANDRMYFALMRHAAGRGCDTFDFGRSKTGSGAYHFKRNWGFEPQPLAYAQWTAPGAKRRDANPTSARHAAQIAVWRRLPLALTNRLGPLIARGLA